MKKNFLFLILLLNFIQSLRSQELKDKTQKQSLSFSQLDELARTYLEKQSLDTAKFYSEKALIQAEKEFGKKDTNYCDILQLLFEIDYYKGNYKRSLDYCYEEKELRKNLQGTNHLGYASAVNNLAVLYYTMSNYVAAEPFYIEGSKLAKRILGKNHPDYATSLNNLAQLYTAMGNYAAAEPLWTEALAILKASVGEQHPSYALSLNNLAVLYVNMGNYKAAESLYTEALGIQKKLLGIKHPSYIRAMNNLSIVYERTGNTKAAESLGLETLKIRKEVFGEKHPDYATSLNYMAVFYSKTGKYSLAEPMFKEVIKIRTEVFGEKYFENAKAMNSYGFMCYTMGNYAAAESLYLQSLNIKKEILGIKHPEYTFGLNDLAILYRAKGNHEAAEPLYLSCIKYNKENIIENFNFLSEKEKELYFKTKSTTYSSFYSFSLQRKNQNPAITADVYNSVITTKGLLLKSSTAMRSYVLNSKDSTLIKQYDKWTALKKEISKLNSIEIGKRKKDPEILDQEANQIEKELVKKSSALNDFKSLQNLKWLDIQKNLQKNEAAIEFIDFSEGKNNDSIIYCALLITPKSKYPEMTKLFTEKELINILGKNSETNDTYITGIYGKRSNANTKLYDLIWKPLEKNLKGIKTIYYSPSGLLHKISFAALNKEKDVYLCDNYRLELQGSTGKLAMKDKFEFNDQSTVSIFGDIQYDTPETLKDTTALLTWPYLEGTKTESEKVVGIFKTSKIKTDYSNGKNATESEFKSKAPESNIVHIATHGFFFPAPDAYSYEEKQDTTLKETRAYRGGNKAVGIYNFVINKNSLMRSGLVFAGANEVWVREESNDKEDGVLTAQEVATLDLRKTNLVVLSACETGLGDIKGTEGVYGLQRSLKMAGVKFIIMSLWQVPDAETVEFMDKFYNKLVKNKDIKVSFDETRNEMRKKYDPFYWAAFVLLE